MKRAWYVVVALASVVVATGAVVVQLRRPSNPVVRAPSNARAPEGMRIRVKVINGTTVHGLARRATMLLRDRGFDVLETGTVNESRDTTLVLDLSGHPDWAMRVAKVLAPARIETRADSSRYLDIAVILGSTWRPPSEPFNP